MDIETFPRCSADALAEQQRLECLNRLEILDTPAEAAYDRITRLVRRLLGVSMSTISFIDGHRQWFKSHAGVEDSETTRDGALCYYTVRRRDALILPDTTLDARFMNNRFVVGKPYIRFYAGFPIFDHGGNCVGTLCAMDTTPRAISDHECELMTELAATVADLLELGAMATIDPLTGALNRRGFLSEANRALALSLRHRLDLSVITFDLDRFKAVNDTFGHDVGDEVLVQTVNCCNKTVRNTDAVGRLGGEEFVVLLPHTGVSAAMALAEKLREAIEQTVTLPDGSPVTASLGVAAASSVSFEIEPLLANADKALYEAKSGGRNRCQLAETPQSNPLSGRRVLKAGKIVFNSGSSVIDCTVRRLSDLAATVDVLSTAGIPNVFKLRIEAAGFSRTCRISERLPGRIEVEFCSGGIA